MLVVAKVLAPIPGRDETMLLVLGVIMIIVGVWLVSPGSPVGSASAISPGGHVSRRDLEEPSFRDSGYDDDDCDDGGDGG